MKRSKQVFLTLLIPAVAAFGCAEQAPAPAVRALRNVAENNNALDCDQPAKPGEPAKVPCSTRHTGGAVTHGGSFVHTGSGSTSSPSSTVTRGGFGGTRTHLSGGS